jgi:predicted dithiol-disulfide oxidoreductase (DUF899 family)
MNDNDTTILSLPEVATHEAWLRARKQLLAKEKAFTRQRDELAAERRRLPMVRVEKEYAFDAASGRRTLLDLFDGRRQLLVYHFMFAPDQDAGCSSCAFVADNLTGALRYLGQRDTAFAAVSRAPIGNIERYRQRMGWDFPWVSSFANGFNHDLRVTLDAGQTEYNYAPVDELPAQMPRAGELPGLSVFVRDGAQVFHAYSTYTRGLDTFMNTYNLLDHTPLGRQETDGQVAAWTRR